MSRSMDYRQRLDQWLDAVDGSTRQTVPSGRAPNGFFAAESTDGQRELDLDCLRSPGVRDALAPERAETALRALGGDVWETFEYAARSELPIGPQTIAFAVRAVNEGAEKAFDRSCPETRTVRAAAYKVRREIHRLLGLLRFAPVGDGTLTAACEPDHDILDLLVPAFRRRFGPESFALVDLRRNKTAVVRAGVLEWMPAEFWMSTSPSRAAKPPGNTECESASDDPEELWRTYYRSTENPSRINPRLRLQFMPKRYWKYLPELDDDGRGGTDSS